MSQKFFHLFPILACCFLAACSSTEREIRVTSGPCTSAPKKATSRPYQIKGIWYYPQPHFEYEDEGIASYYGGGDVFHGRPTATGEIFDMNGVTAAHKTLPLPCMAEVTNLENGRQITLKVNDRGPFVEGRIIDVSRRVAQLLGFEGKGTAKVRVRTLILESLALNKMSPDMSASPAMLADASSSAAPLKLTPASAPAVVAAPALTSAPAATLRPTLASVSDSPSLSSPSPLSTGIFVDVGGFESHTHAATASKKLAGMARSPIQPIAGRGAQHVVRIGPLAGLSRANQLLDLLSEAGHHTARIVIQR